MWNSTYEAVANIGTNPWLTVLSLIVAIIGIILTIIFYFKSKKVKSPCYAIRSNNIIKDFVSKFEALEMRYAGQVIKNLTVSKIAFWNTGGETIDKDDIIRADPIVISIKNDFKILDFKIIAMDNKTNNFQLARNEDQSNVNINFDYIDKNDGIVIQLIHTGYSNNDIDIHGRLKGAGEIIFTDLRLLPKRLQMFEAVIWTLSLFIILTIFYSLITFIDKNTIRMENNFIIILLSISLSFIIMLKGEHYITKKFSKLPTGLESFKEDYTSSTTKNSKPDENLSGEYDSKK